MALSNIFNEPRREITESLIGIVCLIPVGISAYWIACRIVEADDKLPFPAALLMGFLLTAAWIISLIMFIFATHILGDKVCNLFQTGRIHLRPRERK